MYRYYKTDITRQILQDRYYKTYTQVSLSSSLQFCNLIGSSKFEEVRSTENVGCATRPLFRFFGGGLGTRLPDGRAGGVVKLPVVRRWILLSDLQYIRTTCLGTSFFTKSWRAVKVLEYVDVESRHNIYAG